jgi:hypothetical protein
MGPYRRSKRGNKLMFACLSNTSHDVPTTLWDMINISKMGPMIVEWPAKLKVQRQNPPVGSASPRANRMRDKVTQGMANSGHFLGPHRGDPTSSCIVSESRPRCFLQAPLCGLPSSRSYFPARDFPGKLCETT